MEKIITLISDLVWSNVFIGLCLATGLYFSIRTGFLQVTHLKDMIRLLFQKKESKEGISSFQAFALAISGRVGTGNIIGVATAIYFGGPGAVFWMWLIAFLGAASAFIESTLAQVYKQKDGVDFRGGPAYYIEKGLGVKWYAIVFAVVTILSTGLLLPGVQTNAIASSMNNAFEIPVEYTGVIVAVLLALIIFGGVKRLGSVAEYVVPFMAGAYILMALIIIGFNFSSIPDIFGLIFSSAFNLNSTFAGVFGMAIAWGVKRGIYSNEAGQGTAPHAAAAAEVSHPAQQGLVQAFSVYVDTLFVCTATALMILFTGKYNVQATDGSLIVEGVKAADYTGFTQAAVSHHFAAIGDGFVAVALFFFAFTTVMAYYYYAETNIAYLLNNRKNMVVIWSLRILFLLAVYSGAVKTSNMAWAVGDIGVGIMAWVNLIAILLMSKTSLRVWKDYKEKRKKGILNPKFDPEECGIQNAPYWNDKNKVN